LSTLYIRLPSKAAADSASHWITLSCPFALVSTGGMIEREGAASLPDLSELLARTQRVILLVAASDVSLLRVRVPPMSASRLRAALPNLVEDQLITDPAECVVVAGAEAEGLRTVAVVQRAWLDILLKTVTSLGAQHVSALPAQLCLPWQAHGVSAAVTEQGVDIDVALRLSEQDGIGLPIMPEQAQSAADEVVQALRAVVPVGPITLYVPQGAVPAYQRAADNAELADRGISVFADKWSRWISAIPDKPLDLLAGIGGARGPKLDWRRWRWPLALAGAAFTINAIGLNIDWWRMKSEAQSLQAGMIQTYRTAYPKETVIVDPVVQMRQKITAAQHNAGQAGPDDFTLITAAFGEAWASVMQGQAAGKAPPGIAGLEYKDRSLLVRLKPDGDAPTEAMKAALASRDLSLTVAPSQSSALVWQIRSAK
jgi:general secretion pathway protein L